ncbi:DUF7544 domain-containing protein [Halosolutus gelatinilyticus]|uniref:DUF7544 domain-containing protein n=1 Tax=Halosolutus gelatinilyticus TaxID=2931975 RepID=UPI001FF4B2CC|nr:hypothetical protein [Halosolutus gelatinilyticus]
MDAIDDLGDAIDATRNLLTPVRPKMWLKLSIVVLFVVGFGGGASPPTGNFEAPADDPGTGSGSEFGIDSAIEQLPEDFWFYAAIALALVILLWLVFGLISAIMEFVFIESLRTTEVRVRRYARRNVGRGLRLFGFRLVLTLPLLLAVVGPVAYIILLDPAPERLGGSIALVVLVGVVGYAIYAIVMRFTSEFVAPIMLLEDRGVLGGWRRFWRTGTANWAEYAVYLILAWIILLVANIGISLVLLVGGLLLAIPFLVLGAVAYVAGGAGLYLLIPIGLVALVAYLLFYAVVWMPVRTYFKYYALLLLGDTDADLDLIPDQRAAIRSDGGMAAGAETPDEPGRPGGRWGTADEDESSAWDDGTDAGTGDDRSTDSWGSDRDGDDPWGHSDDENDESDEDDRSDRGW